MAVRIQKFRPNDALTPFVRFYYTVESSAAAPFSIQNHPQGGVDLVFAFRGDTLFRARLGATELRPGTSTPHTLAEATPNRPGPRGPWDSLLSGLFVLPLQDHPFETTFTSAVHHVGVSLYPEGASRLLDVNVGECVNSGRDVGPADDRELHELYSQLGSRLDSRLESRLESQPESREHRPEPLGERSREAVALIDQFFCRRLETRNDPAPRFHRVTKEIRRTRGSVSISVLADQVDTSPRSLQRWSQTALGLTPKRYAQIVRFHSTIRLLRRCPTDRWLDTVLGLGYYDQSHFIAEFRRFAGQSPAQFFRSEQKVSEFYSGRRTNLEFTEPANPREKPLSPSPAAIARRERADDSPGASYTGRSRRRT